MVMIWKQQPLEHIFLSATTDSTGSDMQLDAGFSNLTVSFEPSSGWTSTGAVNFYGAVNNKSTGLKFVPLTGIERNTKRGGGSVVTPGDTNAHLYDFDVSNLYQFRVTLTCTSTKASVSAYGVAQSMPRDIGAETLQAIQPSTDHTFLSSVAMAGSTGSDMTLGGKFGSLTALIQPGSDWLSTSVVTFTASLLGSTVYTNIVGTNLASTESPSTGATYTGSTANAVMVFTVNGLDKFSASVSASTSTKADNKVTVKGVATPMPFSRP